VHSFGALTDSVGLFELVAAWGVGLQVEEYLLVLLFSDGVESVLARAVEGFPAIPGDADFVRVTVVGLAGDVMV